LKSDHLIRIPVNTNHIMVEYEPPPKDLSSLNPIQRYMQSGKGPDFNNFNKNWTYLIIGVIIYLFVVRPYIEKAAAWWFGGADMKEGQQALQDHARARAQAQIGPNAIRGTENQPPTAATENLDDSTTGRSFNTTGQVVNRKTKDKSGVEQLLDWDDEPARKPTEGDKSDVVAWLDKWSNEQ